MKIRPVRAPPAESHDATAAPVRRFPERFVPGYGTAVPARAIPWRPPPARAGPRVRAARRRQNPTKRPICSDRDGYCMMSRPALVVLADRPATRIEWDDVFVRPCTPATHCAYCARRTRWSDLALGKAIMDGLDEDVFYAVMDVIGPPYFDWCRQYSPWCIERPACVDCITRALFYLVLGPGSSPIHE